MTPRRFESPSSINTLKQCPRKYYYRYVMGLPSLPSVATVRGKIVHSVLENIFDVDVSGVEKENCREFFKTKAQELLVYYWGKSKNDFVTVNIDPTSERTLFSETLLMLLNWADHLATRVIEHPDEFIHAFKAHTPEREAQLKSEELYVRGFIDAIEKIRGQIRIMDYKTSKKDDISDEYRLQLAIYALLYKEKHGIAPDRVGIYFLKGDGHSEKSIPVDQELMDLARLEIELCHMHTQSNRIHDYQKRVSPLCKWSTGQCDYYTRCFSGKDD
ncbi:PD-(D/E)XK nuclease family protein [Candidatus Woesearchaeota archaeon]|nr:PD-(D/E)XK nuclease family protein [Candidatus Woesearchaeota archaeon]